MFTITAPNVNYAFTSGMLHLAQSGIIEESRGGQVLVAPEPVCTTYLRPEQRVLFHEVRDCNPFFHLMESLWMMAGRNDVDFVAQFNKQMREYSDDGRSFNGAYGFRWRNKFGFDQIWEIVDMLKRDPTTRRAVLSMWDGYTDLGVESKDIPCNTHAYFDARGGRVNLTVCCRSNDAVWGAYGANAVHMSVLLEVVAGMVGLPMGVYRQISNNLHAYLDAPRVKELLMFPYGEDRYQFIQDSYPLVADGKTWLDECERFCNEPGRTREWNNPFFEDVAQPVYMLWLSRDIEWANKIQDDAWAIACAEWLHRREK